MEELEGLLEYMEELEELEKEDRATYHFPCWEANQIKC